MESVDFYAGQSINQSAYYGFKQLAEVAIKALSPGINDPATAVLSLHAITDLLSFRITYAPQSIFHDDAGKARLHLPYHSFRDLFELCYYPIWHYGKEDQYIQNSLRSMLSQLKQGTCNTDQLQLIDGLLSNVEVKIRSNNANRPALE